MVTNPKIGVFHFVFLKLPRAKGKMDIFGGQINVQFWGVKIGQFWGGGIKNGHFSYFQTKYFRRESRSNLYVGSYKFESLNFG
jgi:hypothetical protein